MPFALDRGVASAQPHLSMSSGGIGQAVSVTAGGLLYGARLRNDVFGTAARSDSGGGVSAAAVVTSERNDSALVWRAGAVVKGRLAPERPGSAAPALLSRAALGPAAPGELSASSNRVGDVAVAVLQGAAGRRSLGVAMYDHPPSRPGLRSIRERGRAAAADPLDGGAGVRRSAALPRADRRPRRQDHAADPRSG